MKNKILPALLISFIWFWLSSEVFASTGTVILKPSLSVQMKKQEAINKKVALAERLKAKKTKNTLQNPKKTIGKTETKKDLTPVLTIPPVPQNYVISTKTETRTEEIKTPTLPWVDMQRVYSTWIGWYNETRTELGLVPYTYDNRLTVTASDWNRVFAEGKWQNHHRRNPGDTYYDYKKITAWFAERGVVGKVVGGATTTENVGYGYYNCNSSDCTDTLIRAIRSTFDYYMSEKSYNGLHYKSIVQPNFRKIGLDIIVVPSEKRYYLTVHYITE
jgi:uncharacterized protein YkwD